MDYAYLTAFREPTCENAGVQVVDIHDPANPFEVTDAFMPTSVGSFAGEGIQVVRPPATTPTHGEHTTAPGSNCRLANGSGGET